MRKRRISLLLALIIVLGSFQLGFAVGLDSLTEYNMNLRLDTENHIIYGEEIVSMVNSYNSELSELVFHLYPDSYKSYETRPVIGGFYIMDEIPELDEAEKGYIEIESVHVNNYEKEFTTDNQVLKIPLEKVLKKGDKAEIKIKFKLKIPLGADRFHHAGGEYSLTNWHPILSIYDEKNKKWDENPFHPIGESNYSDVSNYNVKLTVPKNMVVAPTGSIIGEETEGENKTLDIKAEKVRDFVIIMSPNYKVKTKEVDGIKISNYYIPKDRRSKSEPAEKSADIILNEVAKTVKFMNKTVGKYPYSELRIAETDLSGGAMEYPQVIQMGGYYDLSNLDLEDYAPFSLEAAVHETMHQWWYVGVGNNEFKEPFLDESLTVYMTAYYFEKEYGKYHQNGVSRQVRGNIHPYGVGSGSAINSSVADFTEWGDYSEVIYRSKGPGFFEDLRQRIGEEKFIKFLQRYYEKYLFKNATIADLLNTIGEVAGDEIQDIMKKATEDPKYYPKNIQLSEEEQAEFHKSNDKKDIKRKEQQYGIITDSIILRALEGEELIIVKPDGTRQDENIAYFIENMVSAFKYNYNIDIKVVEESKLTSKDKKENLLLVGFPKEHNLMREMSKDLPINIYDEKIKIKGISIENKNVSGTFIAKNPNNEERLVLVIFIDENKVAKDPLSVGDVPLIETLDGGFVEYNPVFEKYNPMHNIWEKANQFIFDIDGIEIRGMYTDKN